MNRSVRARPNLNNDLGVRKHRPDYGLLVIASILLAIGLIVMYAISPALAAQGGGVSDNYFVSRQFIAIILGLLAFWATSKIPFTMWERWQKPLLGFALGASITTILVGGLASRWIQLGTFSFQPVELVKFTLIIVLVELFSKVISNG